MPLSISMTGWYSILCIFFFFEFNKAMLALKYWKDKVALEMWINMLVHSYTYNKINKRGINFFF